MQTETSKILKTAPTYTAQIYVGLREGYDGPVHEIGEAEAICQAYCDAVGLCVTVTPTHFIYKDGREPGCVVGLINYPRFPDTSENIRAKAMVLAWKLKIAFKQFRVTAVFPDDTLMIEDESAYFAALDEIFAETGLIIIVDRFRDRFPDLALSDIRMLYDAWSESRQPKDPQMEKLVAQMSAAHDEMLREAGLL